MLYLTSNCIFFWFPSLSMRVRRCFPWLTEQLDLVILGGLSQIAFVQMPVNRSVTAGVGGLEDKFLRLSGEAFRKVENGVMLGIDQFDLAVQVLPAAGFYRRERDIIDVIVAVVILLRGRKHEPRAADHPVDRLAGTIDPVPSVRR